MNWSHLTDDLDALEAQTVPVDKDVLTVLISELRFLRERKANYMANLGERFASEVGLISGIRTLITKWQADADLCDEAGIESPTMPVRGAIAELRALLGEEAP